MRKLLLFAIILFVIVSCKKESQDNSNAETCNTCTITQKWYINGIYNHTTTVSNTFCGIPSDVTSYENTNTHNDTNLIQSCNCVPK